jgi:RNA polymerase sigma factor (sigma-70 family)
LHGYLKKKHGVDHEDDRNGVLSGACLRVTRSYTQRPGDTLNDFKLYFLKAIDSEVADRWRKHGSRLIRSDEKTLLALSAGITLSASAEDAMIAREERATRREHLELLDTAIRCLPPKQQAVLLLRLNEPTASTAEVALALGTSCDAVRQHLSRGRRRLQELLTGDSWRHLIRHDEPGDGQQGPAP